MSLNYSALKAAMKDAGHKVSAGDNLNASDVKEFGIFAHFHSNLSPEQASYGLAYPETLPKGFPGTSGAPVVTVKPQAATVVIKPVEKPVAPVVAPVAVAPVVAPVAVVETPVVQAPAVVAPAPVVAPVVPVAPAAPEVPNVFASA
jgi:hypothetical protein